MDERKRVVITGIGIVSPAGIGKNIFWKNLKSGRSAIRPITLFDTSQLPNKMAGEITNFDVHNLLGKKGLRNITRSTEFAFVASKLALQDAGIPTPVPARLTDRFGVSFGSATGNMRSILEFDMQTLTEGPRSVNPPDFPNTALNSAASHISIKFNIKGFNTTISTSLVSGLDAIYYAKNMIQNYDYDVVLAGAAEELSYPIYTGFSKLGCLARSGGPRKTEEISCPYDKRRNGLIFSEGACILVLEELGHALKRKRKIYAELKGYGFAFDPDIIKSSGISVDGAAGAIDGALKEFGYPEYDIDYIAGSANSIQRFDIIEAQAIKNTFGKKAKEIPVSAVKSIIGDSFSAGGVFNTASAIGSLEEGYISPTINYRFPDKLCDLNIVANKALKKQVNNILINSFSNNGQNASLIIGRCDA